MPQVALELNFNANVLAAMCNSYKEPSHCPVENGFKCPFGVPGGEDMTCYDITPAHWQAVCLAKEKKDD